MKEINMTAMIPEKKGGPCERECLLGVSRLEIEEIVKKMIGKQSELQEDAVVSAAICFVEKKALEHGLVDPEGMVVIVKGYGDFYKAIEAEFIEQKEGKVKVGFKFKSYLDQINAEISGRDHILVDLEDKGFLEMYQSSGVDGVREAAKILAHDAVKNRIEKDGHAVDWINIDFENNLDRPIEHFSDWAQRIKYTEASTEKDHLFKALKLYEPIERIERADLMELINSRKEKPVLFGVSARYTVGESENVIDRVFLLPPGLSEQAMSKFCCSEVRREIRFIHGSNGFVNKFEGEIIE